METKPIPYMSELAERGETPEILLWVGCAPSYDPRAKKIVQAFVQLLWYANVKFAILGPEETCTGDPAKRAGNEFLFLTQAYTNIQTLKQYDIKRIVTTCPHCFNTLKNEYSELGAQYEVLHHTTYLQMLINEGRLKIEGGAFKGKRITYHDSCYLGRANQIYEAPRHLLALLDAELAEMPRCKSNGLCCGAGGAQMFKEPEPGKKDISTERTEEALSINPDIIAVACPFCMTMLTDGVKYAEKQDRVQVKDVAELLQEALPQKKANSS